MCSPAVIPIVTTAATLLSVGSQVHQAQAENANRRVQNRRAEHAHARDLAMQHYRARIADHNALTARRLADRELAEGRRKEVALRRQAAAETGSRTALMAAGGLALDHGSPLDVLGGMASETESTALTARSDAALAAWRHRQDAAGATEAGRMHRFEADTALPAERRPGSLAGSLLTRAPGIVRDLGSLMR